METGQNSTNEISWTWADQISSYRFWGLFLFFVFLLIPNVIISNAFSVFRDELQITSEQIGRVFAIKSYASLYGFWLAWFMIRMKNHYLLYLFSTLTVMGLALIFLVPSIATLYIGFFLIGLSFGAISLAIPAIISGGRGGSEMFIVSFGIITFINITMWNSGSIFFGLISSSRTSLLVGLASAIIGSVLLIPVKPYLFNTDPPKREFSFTPRFRNPSDVALLCLIPLYNIYFIIYILYRYHGEINSINPTQKILSPRAAAWSFLLIPLISPVILSSLNSSITPRLTADNTLQYNKTWLIILWAFLFMPVSLALIQSNMNKIINREVKS
jgi:MFS family permease